jgi:VWFA-related protein
MKRFFFIAIFLLLCSLTALAQNPAATPPVVDDDTIKISTNLIQIDVTVTDKDGNVVTDLKPEDFEVFENKKKQEITNFTFIAGIPRTSKIEATIPPKTKKGEISVPIPPVKLKEEEVRRTYALVVDDLGLSFESTYWLRQSLRKFIREQMRDGDLVAIVRTGSGVGALQSFTSNKNQLFAAIEKIKWGAQSRSGISAFEALTPNFKDQLSGETADGSTRTVQGADSDKDFAEQLEEFRSRSFYAGTLGALNYVIRGMRDLPGRKSLLLFSEGFRMRLGETFNALRVLADLANRSSVVIYTLDPRGLVVPGMLQAADSTYLMTDAQVTAMLNQRYENFVDTQQSLRYLAYETGGFPFLNRNDLDKAIRKAVDDQNSYYLLGYQPDADTFDPKKNRFNKLEIKVKRPGVKVRYRSGFFSVPDEKLRNVALQTPAQKLVTALISPFNANGINISLYPIYGNDEKMGDYIRALVYIDPKDLKFTETGDGKRKASFDLIAMTFGDNGVPIDKVSKNYSMEITERAYQYLLKKGFVYDLPVPVKKAGAYQFRIALRDTNGDTVGSASQFIEVPNLKKTKLALSNLILDAFSPDEWKKVGVGQDQQISEKSVFTDSTIRRYAQGSVLQYVYVIYNFKNDKVQTPPQMQSKMRLIRDGKVVFEGNQTPISTAGQTDLRRIQASGALTFGKNLEAGNYVLQIVVFDTSEGKKPRTATQFVEFEIY